jgi:hypothetical protein
MSWRRLKLLGYPEVQLVEQPTIGLFAKFGQPLSHRLKYN